MNEKNYYDYYKITDLKDMLNKSGKLYKDNIAYKIRAEKNKYITYTHGEIREMINALGTALIDLGLKGKRVGIISENRLEWEIAYLSVVCGTGVVVPFDKSLPENELKNLIERSEIEAIFYSKKYDEMFEKIKYEGTGKLKHLISMDKSLHEHDVYSEMELIEKGKKLIANGNNTFINAKINPDVMSIMLFTSGTTSASKIVALSHKNIVSNLMDLKKVVDLNDKEVFLSFLPLHHVFECTVSFLFSLYLGAQTVFCDGIRSIVDNLNEYNVSVMASVPGIYERIYKIICRKIEKDGNLEEIARKEEMYRDLPFEEKKQHFADIHEMLGGNLKLMISGAASLEKGIEEKFRLLGLNIVQVYGLTETSPVVAIGTKKNYKLGSIGKSLPSVEVKLKDVNDLGIGELLVKGPIVMLEYYENQEETSKAIVDGWLHTGDLAQIDEEGYIFIRGRKKNVIVLKNGKNIYPEEMENLLNRIEGVEESFIYGKPISDDENDIKIFAKIVYSKEIFETIFKINDEKEIYKAIQDKVKKINSIMPRYKGIKGITITDVPLVKTVTNKIKRKDNLEIILQEERKTEVPKLNTKLLGKYYYKYTEIDSTQKEIWRRFANENIENGTIIDADIQTKGIGTHGRKWYTDQKGNVAFSMFISPNVNVKKLEGLTREIADIIVNVFEKNYNIKLNIKEPNDIVINNKKIGGIITESVLVRENVKALVIGIGLNLNQIKFNDEIKDIAGSIKSEFGIEIEKNTFISQFVTIFDEALLKRIGDK